MVQKQESELADAEQVYPVPYRISYNGTSPKVLIVCEHASKYIPPAFHQLGLTTAEAESHIAWDPGALAVAKERRGVDGGVTIFRKEGSPKFNLAGHPPFDQPRNNLPLLLRSLRELDKFGLEIYQ